VRDKFPEAAGILYIKIEKRKEKKKKREEN
jgi:hypothetical protein